jgi:hypothetical protein
MHFIFLQKTKPFTMKKILFIALLIIPFYGISQTTKPIDGFLGIKFGSSRAAVLAAMKAKGAKIDKENTDKDDLAFSNAKIGSRTIDAFRVRFVNDKAFEADYIFEPGAEGKLIALYNDMIADLTRVYGTGDAVKDYTSPYKEGEDPGDTLVGLSAGKIDFSTSWFDSKKNSVVISINTNMAVYLKYQDSKLTGEAVAKQNAKEKADF